MTQATEKPKVGFYGFTGCGGELLTVLNCESQLVNIFTLADVRSFVMAKSDNIEGKLDVAFVEGSVSTEEQKEHLLEIRKSARLLIAIGDCAAYGGPQAREVGSGWWGENYRAVYGDVEMTHTKALEPRPLSHYVKVDYTIPGCPMDKGEILAALGRILRGIPLDEYPLPVCAECKWNQNPCLLLEGKMCLGPVTQAGCNAVCCNNNLVCVGCRGPVTGANFASELEMLMEKGYSKADIIARMKMYGGVEAARMLNEALKGDNGGGSE